MMPLRTPAMALSLRTRLIAGIMFVAVVLVVVSAVVTVSTRNRLMDQVDQRLTAFSPGARTGGPPPGPAIDLDEFRNAVGTGSEAPPVGLATRVSDVYQGVADSEGELITIFTPNLGGEDYAPPALDSTLAAEPLPSVLTVDGVDGDVTYRVLLQPIGDVIGVTGVPIDDVQDTITRLILVEVLGSLSILAALGLVGWWVLHLGIRPVKQMTNAAATIAGGDLSVRVPAPNHGTESAELANALNTMLGRIETAVNERAASEDRLRRFVSDASHELKTPVTSIRGYAELYRVGALADPADLDDAMRRTEQEAARIGRLVDDMLTLARYDEQRPLRLEPVDLAALVRDGALDASATEPDRPIAVDTPEHLVVIVGDEDRLRQVVANVVTNAVVHTPAETPISLTVSVRDHSAVVEVIDHGPGMTPDVAARVTERFYRADLSRSRDSGGSGLGLSIVDAAVAAHGGSIVIDSSPGAGTTVRLTFPLLEE